MRAQPKPLKVCLVTCPPPPYGGIGNWVMMVLDAAKARPGLKLEIVDVSPRWRAIDDMRVWKRVVVGGLTMLWHVVLVIRRIIGGCRVVHITTPGQLSVFRDVAITAVARMLGVRTLYHIRFGRVPEIAEKNTGEWRRMRLAMKLAYKVIAIDEATEAAIRKHMPGVSLVYVPNCVDLAKLPEAVPVRETQKTAMFLGWVIPTKGVEELVQAWSELRPEGWRLLVAGPGSPEYPEWLKARYQTGGIEFVGEQKHDQALQTMAGSTIFVLPSYTEGFPNVIAEAMALGRPIVTTTVGAIPEMLSGGCGTLVPPRDAGALREALRATMADLDEAAAMGERARRRVEQRYALSAVFNQLEDLWYDAAGRPAVPVNKDHTREECESCARS